MATSYSVSLYKLIDRMEKQHFWYMERNILIRLLITKFFKHPQGKTLLEVGCGTGILLPVFEHLGFSVTGMDINRQALLYAKKKSRARLIHSSFLLSNHIQQFDCIGIFDILEHQQNDRKFLKKCYTLLKPGGYLFLSVPAHQRLWNSIDAMSGHKRRYDKCDIEHIIQDAGFSVRFSHYWNILLFGWYLLWRMQFQNKRTHSDMERYLKTPFPITNTFCSIVLSVERYLFFHVPFPFGSSLIVVGRKE